MRGFQLAAILLALFAIGPITGDATFSALHASEQQKNQSQPDQISPDSRQGGLPKENLVDTTESSFSSPHVGMELVDIPGGCFMMGDSSGDGEEDEQPVHEVCVGRFLMGKYAVTVGQFRKFVDVTGFRTDAENSGGCFTADSATGRWSWQFLSNWKNPGFSQAENHPVVCVSWTDAMEFSKWLTSQHERTYRLPTEAEWEYAARAGKSDRNYWGNRAEDACKYANVSDLTVKRLFPKKKVHNCNDGHLYTAPVGSYLPNDFGLYDMLGNVWQWTSDWYGESYYHDSPKNNPQGPSFGDRHVSRGGSWRSNPDYVRTSLRVHPPTSQTAGVGFRLVSPTP